MRDRNWEKALTIDMCPVQSGACQAAGRSGHAAPTIVASLGGPLGGPLGAALRRPARCGARWAAAHR